MVPRNRPSTKLLLLLILLLCFAAAYCRRNNDALIFIVVVDAWCSPIRGCLGTTRQRRRHQPSPSKRHQGAIQLLLFANNNPAIAEQEGDKNNDDDPFVQAIKELGYSDKQRITIIRELTDCGIWDTDSSSSSSSKTLLSMTNDLLMSDNNTAISTMLIHDFGLTPLTAHQTRSALQHIHNKKNDHPQLLSSPQSTMKVSTTTQKKGTSSSTAAAAAADPISMTPASSADPQQSSSPQSSMMKEATTTQKGTSLPTAAAAAAAAAATTAEAAEAADTITTPATSSDDDDKEHKQRLDYNDYKSVIINTTQQRRFAGVDNHNRFDYGLPKSYQDDFPLTANELQAFFQFMTVPSTDSHNETPIRPATANVYIRHAKLFLGWYWNVYLPDCREAADDEDEDDYDHVSNSEDRRTKNLLSIYKIFPTKEKESVTCILAFLIWLRSVRNISVSYEANLLRGLIKLLKFRFCKDSVDEDSSKSFDDIPVVRELRKWHRDANRKQTTAPRVSNEERKWLSWPEYLQVVQSARADVRSLINAYDHHNSSSSNSNNKKRRQISKKNKSGTDEFSPQQRKIALAFQKYLILAIFSNIPDRQRTIRELEIGRSFVKDDQSHQWCIKHAPEDYKTGNTYGERPPLHLPIALTTEIDEFIEQWRPCLLRPSSRNNRNTDNGGGVNRHKHLFVQSRTGNPLTQDSVYHNVAHTCYKYTGQKTNPHLLRDMIVTHVRESSDASEQQLEALALFMGHSVQIQRKSYDRRTLTKKVAPAVALMEQVNNNNSNKSQQ